MNTPHALVERLRAKAKANAAALRWISNGVEIARPDHKPLLEWEAADRIEALERALELAVSRGCDHCAEPIRAARAALSEPNHV